MPSKYPYKENDLLLYTAEDYEGEFNLARHERQLILKTYGIGGNYTYASLLLKISLRNFYRKVKRHKITKRELKNAKLKYKPFRKNYPQQLSNIDLKLQKLSTKTPQP